MQQETRRKWCWIGVAALGALLYAPAGWAARPQSDTQFAKAAGQANYAEVKLGQLAEQKSSNETVKDFGKRMAHDHEQSLDQLASIGSKQGIRVPKQMDPEAQAEYDRLAKLSGREFDKEYAKLMVRDHQQDIAKFQNEATSGSDPAIKNYAQETLPTLQTHLQLAEQMEQSVQKSGH